MFVDSQGSTYEGDWLNDRQHGQGCETWEEGKVRFTGTYVDGIKEGHGRYDWSDSSHFEGEFVDSKFQG